LQIKIERTNMDNRIRKLTISQKQYIETILEQYSMANCKPAKTSMAANLQLLTLTEAKIDIIEYQRYIGSLMYLMIYTHPNIAYSVGVLSRHVACPGRTHIQAVKHVF